MEVEKSVASRIRELDEMVQNQEATTNSKICHSLVYREGLLDALMVLYKECCTEKLMKNKLVSAFVKKYERTIKELKMTRINVSDFECKDVIGRGHFGEVQVVRERATGTVHAMKTLRKCDTLNQSEISFFEEERDIMAKASSPWITQLHYAFQDSVNLYLVMEFHPGGDLLSHLSRFDDTFNENMTRFYLAEMTVAIHALHIMGYLHRDVKPENILLTLSGHIKLADFGSSSKLSGTNQVSSRMPVGTPDYVSPELLISMNCVDSTKKYGVEVDWWSLGICAYEMLYGKTPFTDEKCSMVATYSNIMNFKKSLKFKDSALISKEAVDLIKSLLTGKEARLGYFELLKHPFFKEIDWDNLRNTSPPFIPTVSSLDDTSNFDDFEKVQYQPPLTDPNLYKDFNGCDLPFIGFTYVKEMPEMETEFQSRLIKAAIETKTVQPQSSSSVEVKFTVKVEELQTLKERCDQLEQREISLQKELEEVQQDREQKEKCIINLRMEKNNLTTDLNEYSKRSDVLMRMLEEQLGENHNLEEEALKLWEQIHILNSESFAITENMAQSEVQMLRDTVIQKMESEQNFLVNQLLSKEKQLTQCKQQLQKQQQQIDALHTKLDKERRKSREDQKMDRILVENEDKCWTFQLDEKAKKMMYLEDKNEELQKHIEALEVVLSTYKEPEKQRKEQEYLEREKPKTPSCQSSRDKRQHEDMNKRIMELEEKLEKSQLDSLSWGKKAAVLQKEIKELMEDKERHSKAESVWQVEKEQLTSNIKLKLLNQLKTYQEEIQAQKQVINELKENIQMCMNHDKNKSELEEKIKELEEELSRCAVHKSTADSREKQQNRKIQELEEELSQFAAKKTSTDTKERQLNKKIQDLEEDLLKHASQKSVTECREKHLNNKIKDLEEQLSQSHSVKVTADFKERQLNRKIRELEAELLQHQTHKLASESRDHQAGKKIKDLQEELSKINSQKNTSESKERQLNSKLKVLETEISNEKFEKLCLEKKKKQLVEKVEELEEDLSSSVSKRLIAESKERQCDMKIKKLEEEIIHWKLQTERTGKQKDRLEQQLKDSKLAVEEKNTTIQNLEAKFDKHKSDDSTGNMQRLKKVEQEKDSYKLQAERTIKQKERLEQQLKDSKLAVEEKNAAIWNLETELEKQKSLEYTDNIQRIKFLETEVKLLKDDKDSLANAAKIHQQDYKLISKKVKEQEQLISSLNKTIEELQSKMEVNQNLIGDNQKISDQWARTQDDEWRKHLEHRVNLLEKAQPRRPDRTQCLFDQAIEKFQVADTLEKRIEELEKQHSQDKTIKTSAKEKLVEEKMKDLEQENSYLQARIACLEQHLGEKNQPKAAAANDSNNGASEESKKINMNSLGKEVKELKLSLSEVRSQLASCQSRERTAQRELERMQQQKKNLSFDKECQLQNAEVEAEQCKQELKSTHTKAEKMSKQYEELQERMNRVLQERSTLSMENQSLQDELHSARHQCEVETQNVETMRMICAELEIQITDLEKINERYVQREAKWSKIRKTYEKAVDEREEQLEDTCHELQAKKEDRDAAHERVHKLKLQLHSTKAHHQQTVDSLQIQLKDAQKNISKLKTQKSGADLENSRLQVDLKYLQEAKSDEEDDKNKLKELLSKQITINQSLREENIKLKKNLEEAMDKFELIFGDKVDLEKVMELLQSSHSLEKFRFESILGQQMKLIDYMHALMENSSIKKKKSGKLFGSSKQKDVSVAPKTLHLTDLCSALEQERTQNVKLQEQLEILKQENSYQTAELCKLKEQLEQKISDVDIPVESMITALAKSPSSQMMPNSVSSSSLTSRMPQPLQQRMHHNIPHRFVSGLNTRATKCAVCLGSVHFVKQASKCHECHIVCHPKCVSAAHATCGLPTEYIRNFTSIMKKLQTESRHPSGLEDSSVKKEGWLKVSRVGKPLWEQKWVKLDGNLLIFNDKNEISPVDSFELCPQNGEVAVHSAVTTADLPNMASSDLPFVMRLEHNPDTTCWPGKMLYIMALNFSDKQQWAATLEAAVNNHNNKYGVRNKKLLSTVVLSLEECEKLELNCSLIFSKQTLLLGAEEGLFMAEVQNQSFTSYIQPVQISGIESVYYLTAVPSLGMILMITGSERHIKMIDKLCVKNPKYHRADKYTEPIPHKVVEGIQRCTVFSVSMWEDSTYLCVGMIDKVLLLKYNYGLGIFCVRKEFGSISEPCSCVCIAENFAIVGTHKFYRVDLEHPSMSEFVDGKDQSLAFAAFGAASHNSYPLGVVQVSPHGICLEFLLCFHEFGVFVDGKGRRSRTEDLKWSGLPLAFAFQDPYLFVTYFNRVQAIEIPMNRQITRGTRMVFDKVGPRYLGRAPASGAVYYAFLSSQVTEIICLYGSHSENCKGMTGIENDREVPSNKFERHVHFVSPVRSPIQRRSSWSSMDSLDAPSTSSESTSKSSEAECIYGTIRRNQKHNTVL